MNDRRLLVVAGLASAATLVGTPAAPASSPADPLGAHVSECAQRALGQRVDPNQEMVGLGAANLAAGFFQGFAISSSSSRTPVAEAAGAKTQVTGVVGALIVAVLIVAAPMLFQNLPNAALAAVVIAAAIGLFEFGDLGRIYRIQRWEFWLSILCTVGVALFGAFLAWAVADFASARRRDRRAGKAYPPGSLGGDATAVVAGVVAWAVFAFLLHGWLIGVRPFG